MPTKKLIQPGEKVPLKLTAAERKLILEGLLCLDQQYEEVIRETPAGEPIAMSLDDLEDFGGYIAAEANHCSDRRKQDRLDVIFEKIQALLDAYTEAEPPKTIKIEDARKSKFLEDQSAQIAEFAAKALVAAEMLGTKTKPLKQFALAPAQRSVLLLVPGVTKAIKRKLAKDGAAFSIAEVASMILALAEDLPDGDARKQVAVLHLVKHLMDHLQDGITGAEKPWASMKSNGNLKLAAIRHQSDEEGPAEFANSVRILYYEVKSHHESSIPQTVRCDERDVGAPAAESRCRPLLGSRPCRTNVRQHCLERIGQPR